MTMRHAREPGAAHRTGGWNLRRFFLRGLLGDGPLKFARLVRDLFFDMAQIVVRGTDTPVRALVRAACQFLTGPANAS
jgi:hypothetical protein